MKVYIAIIDFGEHDSFNKWIEKVFIDKDRAEEYAKERNIQIQQLKKAPMPPRDKTWDPQSEYSKWHLNIEINFCEIEEYETE